MLVWVRRSTSATVEHRSPELIGIGFEEVFESVAMLCLGIHVFRASKTLMTTETPRNETHKHHRPVTLQPSLMVSGSLMERPAMT